MSRKERKNLTRILVALGLFFVVITTEKLANLARFGWYLPFALYLVVYLLIGYDVLWRAARNIAHGQIFDENFLMCIATLGAFALAIYRGATGASIEGFDEACAVLLFYQVGEFFQGYATGRSRKSIAALMDIRPDYAHVRRDGHVETVDPSEVAVGETLVVRPGERVPLDGVIVSGASALDTKALTGESAPRDVQTGDEIISGTVNLTSELDVKATKEFYDSTVHKILDLVENAASQKSKAENFITKFAKYYTPAVVTVAVLLAVVPGAVTGDWAVWIYRALSFLVVSCPCALVISIPLSFFAGIGAASRHGILVKGSNYIERFDRANVFVFDKTGTLTKGNFAVAAVTPADRREAILRLAAVAEEGYSHPIAGSILAAFGRPVPAGYARTAVPGQGVIADNGTERILCGNEKLMAAYGVPYVPETAAGTVVYVATVTERADFVGSIRIADEVKPEAKAVISALNERGRTVMLTGDNESVAAAVAAELGVSEYKASLLPHNKVEEVERLLADKAPGDTVCFVGDGINDAPVLMRADMGVAMGGVGSDAAIEAADAVLMRDDLGGLPLLKRIARKTMAVVRENVAFSLGVKGLILVLSALGVTNMWFAVFGDVGVAVLAILNAMRVNTRYADKSAKRECAHEKV